MRTTIDKAGRVVIPRQIRQQAGLAEGGEVDIEFWGGVISLEPVVDDELIEVDGLLFIPGSGEPLTVDSVRELIDAQRYERLERHVRRDP